VKTNVVSQLLPDYEWTSGLGTKFGLQYVNLTSQERHPKASMFQFLNWFESHGLGKNASSAANVTVPTYGRVRV